MRVNLRSAILLFLPALLLGCSPGRRERVPDAADANPDLVPARAEYRANCSACHGRDGAGSRGLYPPLTGETWAARSKEAPVRIVLHGLEGELELGGARYFNKMPPLGDKLADKQIARILTYVRGSWGNNAGPVTEAEVARIRAATRGRKTPWTPEEIESLLAAEGPTPSS